MKNEIEDKRASVKDKGREREREGGRRTVRERKGEIEEGERKKSKGKGGSNGGSRREGKRGQE